MRTVLVLGTLLFLGALILVPAVGTASQANLVITSGIPAKIYGHTTATSTDAVLRLGATSDDIRLSGSSLQLETIRITSSYARLPGLVDATGEQRVESTRASIPGGTLGLQALEQDALIVATGNEARIQSTQAYAAEPSKNFWSEANAQLSALIASEILAPPSPVYKLAQVGTASPNPVLIPTGSYAFSASGSAFVAAHEVLVYGARLIDANGQLIKETRRETTQQPGSLFVAGPNGGSWTGPGTHVEEVVEYFVLHGIMDVAAQGDATLYAQDVRVQATGFIGFPWAQGTVRTANETFSLGGEQVILGGDLRLRPIGFDAQHAPQITLLGDGVVQFLRIGVAQQNVAPAVAAAVAGSAAGLGGLALLLYFWPSVKYAFSLVLFPLYARVPKENTLDHKGRELLYDLIKNEPGVSTNKLAKEVPFGWSTLTYHLRVLERNEAIVSVRDGRYKRFFDRQSGRFANGRKYILAVLKNEATYDIARYIKDRPGSSQKEVASHFQLSPSSVHWHVERLTEVGLVTKAREAHNVKYAPGEAWDHVTIEDLKALQESGLENGVESAAAVSAPSAPNVATPGPAQ